MKPYLILGQTTENADTRIIPRGCMLVSTTSFLTPNVSEVLDEHLRFLNSSRLFDALQNSDTGRYFHNPIKFKEQIEDIVGNSIKIYKEGESYPFLKYDLFNSSQSEEFGDKIAPSGVWPIRAGIGAMMLNPYLDDPYSLLKSQPVALAFSGSVFPTMAAIKTVADPSFKFLTETTQEILFQRLPGIYYNFSSKHVRHEDVPEPLPTASAATSFRGLRSMYASTQLFDSEVPVRVHLDNAGISRDIGFPFEATVYPNKTPLQIALREKILMPLYSQGVIPWIKRQSDYTAALPARDILFVKAYSYKGDTILNNYLRGRPLTLKHTNFHETILGVFQIYLFEHYNHFARFIDLPDKRILKPIIDDDNSGVITLETESFILAHLDFFGNPANYGYIMEQYKRDLIRIISAAPRLSKPIVVYRGFKSEHITSLRFVNKDFVSTSLSYVSANEFAKEEGGLYQITIHANVPCLCIDSNVRLKIIGQEFEVLLPPGLSFQLGNQVYRKELIYAVDERSKINCNPIDHTFIDVIHANVVQPMKRKTAKRRDKRRRFTTKRLFETSNS